MLPNSNSNAHSYWDFPRDYTNFGNRKQQLLWFDLGARDPLFILPIVAGITTFIQQKMMMAGNANQNPQMAMMLWIMPIMIVVLQSIFQPPYLFIG